MGFLANMLGIHIGIGDDSTKNGGGTETDKVEGSDLWDTTPLYGDDRYVARPVPKGCPELSFQDQMVIFLF